MAFKLRIAIGIFSYIVSIAYLVWWVMWGGWVYAAAAAAWTIVGAMWILMAIHLEG